MGDGDDSEDGGRRPKILKPIFNKAEETAKQAPVATTTTAAATVAATQAPKQESAPQPVAPQAAQPRPQQPAIAQGRPEALRQTEPGARKIGGMFKGVRTSLVGEQKPSEDATPKAVEEKKESLASITNEMLVQAWTSFALKLPERERALADRMKIITPTLVDGNIFTISVDNQLVADVFDKEAERITSGISSYLNGIKPTMKININKVVVQRHVYDRTKQFEILKEKNHIIGKLREVLNLELS